MVSNKLTTTCKPKKKGPTPDNVYFNEACTCNVPYRNITTYNRKENLVMDPHLSDLVYHLHSNSKIL